MWKIYVFTSQIAKALKALQVPQVKRDIDAGWYEGCEYCTQILKVVKVLKFTEYL